MPSHFCSKGGKSDGIFQAVWRWDAITLNWRVITVHKMGLRYFSYIYEQISFHIMSSLKLYGLHPIKAIR